MGAIAFSIATVSEERASPIGSIIVTPLLALFAVVGRVVVPPVHDVSPG